ncbi:hypothetical protein [uncultured Roseobacter sp.]|uniref:hypothetical protein n=1 Tax=uncultured Roseobacter sp. TaxID=114847 RepID=UPI00263794F9|nr:hypothetical protein [uncultured Roseobacter sp.]
MTKPECIEKTRRAMDRATNAGRKSLTACEVSRDIIEKSIRLMASVQLPALTYRSVDR